MKFTCKVCGLEKDREEMSTAKAVRGGEQRIYVTRSCRKCVGKRNGEATKRRRQTPEGKRRMSEYKKKYRTRDPERNRQEVRRSSLMKYYGMTVDQYDELLKAQDGACAVCRLPPTGKRRLHVDHDHETGAIRGLLCSGCNTGIGAMLESPLILMSAIAYLGNDPKLPGKLRRIKRKGRGEYAVSRKQLFAGAKIVSAKLTNQL